MMIPAYESIPILAQLPPPQILLDAFFKLSAEADAPGKVRTGLVLAISIYNLRSPSVGYSLSYSIGDAAAESLGGWNRNAPEKNARLFSRRRTEEGRHEVTSAESAKPDHPDADRKTYGGSVVFVTPAFEAYIAVSGGHPLVDEALSYATGCKLGLRGPKIPHENPYIEKALGRIVSTEK